MAEKLFVKLYFIYLFFFFFSKENTFFGFFQLKSHQELQSAGFYGIQILLLASLCNVTTYYAPISVKPDGGGRGVGILTFSKKIELSKLAETNGLLLFCSIKLKDEMHNVRSTPQSNSRGLPDPPPNPPPPETGIRNTNRNTNLSNHYFPKIYCILGFILTAHGSRQFLIIRYILQCIQ